jgi:hypothetical protein
MTVEHRRSTNTFNDLQHTEHGQEMNEDEDPEVTVRRFFPETNVAEEVNADLAEQMAERMARISTLIDDADRSMELHHDLKEHIYEFYNKH